jgi:mRNA interferase MazF
MDPTIGREIKKTRPAVVLSIDTIGSLDLRIVVPLTGYQEKHGKFPWCVPITKNNRNGLSKDSTADAFQIKCVSLERFTSRIGTLSAGTVDAITSAVALCIDI